MKNPPFSQCIIVKNRPTMLHFISWKMYGVFLILALTSFYSYLLYKNKALLKAWIKQLIRTPATTTNEADPTKNPTNPPAAPVTNEKSPNAAAGNPAAANPAVANPDIVKPLLLLALLLPAITWAQTADGVTGINEANTLVRSYFDPAVNLMYAVGAVSGIVGGYKVFRAMNGHNHQADQSVAWWFGGCVFLVLVATVLKAFFGL
jgi:hypothetical protein